MRLGGAGEDGHTPLPSRTGAPARAARTYARSGALAGAAAAVGFALVHDLLISDIWATLPVMAVAGASCGLCLGWTYGLLFDKPSISGWLGYTLVYVALFGLLGALSVIVFEPVTTIAALIDANEPPGELIVMALPLTVAFTVVAAAVVSLLFGRGWSHYASILLTLVVLVAFLGLNVSVIGLVDIPAGAVHLVVELFGLVVALAVMFAAAFVALEWKRLRG